MKTIPAKTIIAKADGSRWFGIDYNMNIYRGCCHGCIYCDSRSECYRVENFDTVTVKENALALIRKELAGKRKKGVIASGSMSDPYNPFEKSMKLTRQSLELINDYGFGCGLTTKSPLITRDSDILKKIQEHSPVITKITVTCADDKLSLKTEPFAPPSSERFAALKKLSESEIFAGVLMMPLLPFINDTQENMISIIKQAKQNGAKFIFPSFGVTLRANQRDYFYEKLDESFAGIKNKYIRVFGGEYACNSPRMKNLYEAFENTCKKEGLIYKMNDIIRAYKSKYLKTDPQLSLF